MDTKQQPNNRFLRHFPVKPWSCGEVTGPAAPAWPVAEVDIVDGPTWLVKRW